MQTSYKPTPIITSKRSKFHEYEDDHEASKKDKRRRYKRANKATKYNQSK